MLLSLTFYFPAIGPPLLFFFLLIFGTMCRFSYMNSTPSIWTCIRGRWNLHNSGTRTNFGQILITLYKENADRTPFPIPIDSAHLIRSSISSLMRLLSPIHKSDFIRHHLRYRPTSLLTLDPPYKMDSCTPIQSRRTSPTLPERSGSPIETFTTPLSKVGAPQNKKK